MSGGTYVIVEFIHETLDDGTIDSYVGDVLGPFLSEEAARPFTARRGHPGLTIRPVIRQLS